MNRTIVYPFNEEFLPIIRHKNLVNDLEITKLVSLNGWGYIGKDAGFIDYGEPIGINVENNFESALEESDKVIFCDYRDEINYKRLIEPKINMAIEKGKDIVCLLSLSNEEKEKIEEKCKSNGVKFAYYNNEYKITFEENHFNEEKLEKIDVPVIFVIGMMENADKFEVQLALRDGFLREGYKVSQIGSRRYSSFFNMKSIPDFMFRKDVKEYEKIVFFNRYIKEIERRENPDVIIIGVPGAILPVNEKFKGDFGIMAFEISRAVTPDATVLCSNYVDFNEQYFKELHLLLKYRFGLSMDCIYMNNKSIDYSEEFELSLININGNKVEKKVEEGKKFNLCITSNSNEVYKNIIELMSVYANVDLI